MLRIPCPCCGLRDETEFEYGGDATVAYPALDASAEEWFDAVYIRDDPEGPHREYWRHARGCGLWLIVTRNTGTHEILGAEIAHPGLAAATATAADAGKAEAGA